MHIFILSNLFYRSLCSLTFILILSGRLVIFVLNTSLHYSYINSKNGRKEYNYSGRIINIFCRLPNSVILQTERLLENINIFKNLKLIDTSSM